MSWLECGSSLLSSRMWPGILRDAPVSVVVAEIVMQNIEEQALATYTRTVPLWLRYVDDTFTAIHKDGIDDFHEHLNRQNADIQFTKEIEENGKIPFLDCLVTPDNNKLKTTIYRKLTHTDRLLDQSSYNPTCHKATTIRILTRRVQLVCDLFATSLRQSALALVLIYSKLHSKSCDYLYLWWLLTNVKDKDKPEDMQGAVYKIKCCDCRASYIGETGRNLSTQLTKHKWATRNGDVNNHIAEYHFQIKHQIDWDSATWLYNVFYSLLSMSSTLESWFTNLEQTPLNRSQQLPVPYKRLIDEIKQN